MDGKMNIDFILENSINGNKNIFIVEIMQFYDNVSLEKRSFCFWRKKWQNAHNIMRE